MKSDLIEYFQSFDNREIVKYAVMNMNRTFRDIVEMCY